MALQKVVRMTDTGSNKSKSTPPTAQELAEQAAKAKAITAAYNTVPQGTSGGGGRGTSSSNLVTQLYDTYKNFQSTQTPTSISVTPNITAPANATAKTTPTATPTAVSTPATTPTAPSYETNNSVDQRSSRIVAAEQAQYSPYSGTAGAPTVTEDIAHKTGTDTGTAQRVADILGISTEGDVTNPQSQTNANAVVEAIEVARSMDNGNNGGGSPVINNGGGNPAVTFNGGSGINTTSVPTPQNIPTSEIAPVGTTGLDELKALYESEYEQNMRDLEERRRQQEIELQNRRQSALDELANNYNANVSGMQNENERALREAYINYKLGQRNVEQQLANAGITGGATESILANLFNTYGNNRNVLNQNLQDRLADLSAVYNTNVANAEKNSSGDYTDLLDTYYNNIANVRNDYSNNLQDLALRDYNAQLESQLQAQQLNADLEKARLNAASKASSTSGLSNYGDLGTTMRSNIVSTLRALNNNDRETYLNNLGLSDSAKSALITEANAGNTNAATTTTSNKPWGNLSYSNVASNAQQFKNDPEALVAYLDSFPNASTEDINQIIYSLGMTPETLATRLAVEEARKNINVPTTNRNSQQVHRSTK